MSLGPGSTLGPFKIQSLIGKGGMGEVFSAIDTRLERRVALKILPHDFASDADRLRRFQSEAKTLASLNHPNILVIYEVGTDGRPYLVSELLEGRTLREELNGKPLPLRKAIDYALQIAQGLAAAHARGIVHRDLKPENIFITKDGRAKILDFGLAKSSRVTGLTKLTSAPPGNDQSVVISTATEENVPTLIESTAPGLILGTPAYMSPEQVRGEPADPRADIFALGCVLCEMLTGKQAFRRKTAAETMSAVLNEAVPEINAHSEIAPALVQVIERALEKDASHRFQSASDLAFALSQTASSNLTTRTSVTQTKHVWLRVALPLLLLTIGIFCFWLFVFRTRPGLSAVPTSPNPAPLALEQKSVAVRPFDNRSADKADEYLSDGLTEELLNALMKVKGLHVPGRSSSFAFKGRNEEGLFRKMGDQLHVGAILEGSVRKSADRLRVSVNLVNVADGFSLWSETYDRDMTNIFAIQSDIAGRVAAALKLQLLGVSFDPKNPTTDIEAYKLYLQYLQLRNQATPQSITNAIDCLNRAVSLDPNYAMAHAGLANCYFSLREYGGLAPGKAKSLARASAQRALDLDNSLAEPRVPLAAIIGFCDWNWSLAETEFRRAIDSNPNYATSHGWLGLLLHVVGRHTEELDELQRAIELDPLSPILVNNRALALFETGKEKEAFDLLNDGISARPQLPAHHYMLGELLLQQHRWAEAATELDKAHALAPEYMLIQSWRGLAYARLGRTGEARQILERLLEAQRDGQDAAVSIALVEQALGDDEQALKWLENAAADHANRLEELSYSPHWDRLRPHPRAQAILRKMNLLK